MSSKLNEISKTLATDAADKLTVRAITMYGIGHDDRTPDALRQGFFDKSKKLRTAAYLARSKLTGSGAYGGPVRVPATGPEHRDTYRFNMLTQNEPKSRDDEPNPLSAEKRATMFQKSRAALNKRRGMREEVVVEVNTNTKNTNDTEKRTPKERGAALKSYAAPRFLIKRFNKDTGMKIKPRKQRVEEEDLSEISADLAHRAHRLLTKKTDKLLDASKKTNNPIASDILRRIAIKKSDSASLAGAKYSSAKAYPVHGGSKKLKVPATEETIAEISADKLKTYIDRAADYVYDQPNMRVRDGGHVYARSVSQVPRHGRGITKAAEILRGKQLLRDQRPVSESKADDSAKLASAVAAFKGKVTTLPAGARNTTEKDFFKSMITGKKVDSAPRVRAYDVDRPSRGGVPRQRTVSLARVGKFSEQEELTEIQFLKKNVATPTKERSIYEPGGTAGPTTSSNVVKKKIESVTPSAPGISRKENADLSRQYLNRTINRMAGDKLKNPLAPEHVHASAVHNAFESAVKSRTYPSEARHAVRGMAKRLGADSNYTKNIHTAMHAGATGEHLHIGLAREHLHRLTAGAEGLTDAHRDEIHKHFENGPAQDNTGKSALNFSGQAKHHVEHHQELVRAARGTVPSSDKTTQDYLDAGRYAGAAHRHPDKIAASNAAIKRPTGVPRAKARPEVSVPDSSPVARDMTGYKRPEVIHTKEGPVKAPTYDVGHGEAGDTGKDYMKKKINSPSHDDRRIGHGIRRVGALVDRFTKRLGPADIDRIKREKGVTEEVEVAEVLDRGATSANFIHDFVHSDDARFSGKAREERIKMALGAYYARQRTEDYQGPGGGPDPAQPLQGSMYSGHVEDAVTHHTGLIDHHDRMRVFHADRDQDNAMLLHDIARWGHKHALTALQGNLVNLQTQLRKANAGSVAANAATRRLAETSGPDTNVDSLVPTTQPGLTRPDFSVDTNYGAANV